MKALFYGVVSLTLGGSWTVLGVLLVRALLSRCPMWVRIPLWGLAGLRLLCPFVVESKWSLFGFWREASSGASGTAPENTALPAVLWAAGAVCMAVYYLISRWRLEKQIRHGTWVRDNIYRVRGLPCGFVLGVFRPRIYLPAGMDAQAEGHILSHEKAHIARGDHLWKPLGFLALSVHWFNPLIWMAYGLFCRDMELACDARVIGPLDSEGRAEYTQTLLTCSGGGRSPGPAFGENSVKARARAVMRHRKTSWAGILAWVLSSVLLFLCFLTVPPAAEAAVRTEPEPLPDISEKARQEQEVLEQELEELRIRFQVCLNSESAQYAEGHREHVWENGTISVHGAEHGHH